MLRDSARIKARPWYGREMVEYALRSTASAAAQRNFREAAGRIFDETTLSLRARMLFEAQHELALASAERALETPLAVVRKSEEEEERPAVAPESPPWQIAYALYWNQLAPLLPATLGRATAALSGADRAARAYFVEAMIRVWKICEASPFCCEENMAVGGASAKKKRAHTTVSRIAVAALYMLSEGLEYPVCYDRSSGSVRLPTTATSSLRRTPAVVDDATAHEKVVFLPPHRYLQRRLPRPNEVHKFIDLPDTADGSILEARGWIKKCYRSLLSTTPPLKIDEVRGYRLDSLLATHDEPTDRPGRFEASAATEEDEEEEAAAADDGCD